VLEVSQNPTLRKVKGLYRLIRVAPVMTWGISSSLLGLGFALAGNQPIRWVDYGLVLLFITVTLGVVSHAFNDHHDWLSGTDRDSPGILSGGSGIVADGTFDTDGLSMVGKNAIMLTIVIGTLFWWRIGWGVIPFLAIAIWSATAYTCPPLRLSYRPLVGEWLCAFPAVAACAVGTFYVLTGTIQPAVLAAGAIHGLLAIGLLMHHHLSDIPADLRAQPPKMTTVAAAGCMLSIKQSHLVGVVYFTLALLTGVAAGLYLHPVLLITVPFALACAWLELGTNPLNVDDITHKEYLLYWLVFGDAAVKTAWLLLGRG
jgi:1,4-dihydroxy-2-naphthoate octaprenyltransferase